MGMRNFEKAYDKQARRETDLPQTSGKGKKTMTHSIARREC